MANLCRACESRPAPPRGYCEPCADEIREMMDEIKPLDGDSYDDAQALDRWDDEAGMTELQKMMFDDGPWLVR